jgi:antitoxin MazE
MQVQVARWGNSLGLHIPKEVAREAGLAEGMRVEVAARDGRVVISRTQSRYRLEELLEGMTPEDMHGAFDWGPDIGREIVG